MHLEKFMNWVAIVYKKGLLNSFFKTKPKTIILVFLG